MAGEAASSSERAFGLPQSPAGGTDQIWETIVGSVDTLLRAYYGIREFTDDPDCLFRLALVAAREPIRLADGTQIHSAEMIGALHWWNEHLPRYLARGPDLVWAREMRRRIRHSLRLLTEHVDRDPVWRPVAAFRGDATFASRLGARQVRRVAGRYGFELVEPDRSMLYRIDAIAASFTTWALTRAFNPSALPRQPFLRGRYELWIARSTLQQRYGRAAPHVAGSRSDRYG
jgi:YkoP domain